MVSLSFSLTHIRVSLSLIVSLTDCHFPLTLVGSSHSLTQELSHSPSLSLVLPLARTVSHLLTRSLTYTHSFSFTHSSSLSHSSDSLTLLSPLTPALSHSLTHSRSVPRSHTRRSADLIHSLAYSFSLSHTHLFVFSLSLPLSPSLSLPLFLSHSLVVSVSSVSHSVTLVVSHTRSVSLSSLVVSLTLLSSLSLKHSHSPPHAKWLSHSTYIASRHQATHVGDGVSSVCLCVCLCLEPRRLRAGPSQEGPDAHAQLAAVWPEPRSRHSRAERAP